MIIKVKEYMTKPSNPDFDFMERFNNNKPMPYTTMTGNVVKRTPKMVYMDLEANNITWQGWIPISAITVIDGEDLKSERAADKKVILDLEEDKIFVTFDYDVDIISTLRKLPNRKYIPNSRKWEVPIDDFEVLMFSLSKYNIALRGQLPSKNNIDVPGFKFKTKPYQHQIDGFNYGMSKDKWLLGDEQGLGKSKQVIDIAIAKKLQKNYKHCLIICGVNGLKWNWANEIKTHSNEQAYILGQRIKNKKIKIGSMNDRIDDLRHLKDIDAYFLIMNIESLRNSELVACIQNLIKDGMIDMICADEVHKMKNPQSQQGKGFLKLNAETLIAMSGTPLMNNPLDLYIILKWLGYETHTFYAFKNHYCIMGGYGDYEIVGYRNLDQLQNQLNSIMLRRLKNEVLDLPDKTYIDEYIEMTPKQEKIYKEVTSDIKDNIDKIKSAPNPLSEMIRMRQATGYTGILSSKVKESAKLDRVAEIVQDALENGKKVVIFSNWTQMTDAIDSRLADTRVPGKNYFISADTALITGETNDSLRQDIVDAFQNTDDLKVLIGTIGAMGTGLTLTAGTVEIFVDHPWNMAHYQQAVDRCHRIGQSNNITVYNLMCKDTIDERIWNIVKQKGALSDMIVDGIEISNKSDMVDYLLS